MNIAYVRVSTIEQSEARQVEALRVHQIDKWFRERYLAKIRTAPNFRRCSNLPEKVTPFTFMISAALPAALPTCSSWWKPCRQKYPLGQQQGKHRHPHAYGKADVDHDCRHQ